MALAERCGLAGLVRRHVQVAGPAGVNADLKAGCLVAGMAAGADSIDDMDVLRHGAMDSLFGGIWAPSTLGSFLRSFTWGSARQLEKASRMLLAGWPPPRRCSPARTRWRSWTWTRCRNGSTVIRPNNWLAAPGGGWAGGQGWRLTWQLLNGPSGAGSGVTC
jgi:hypothetical protein